LHELLDDALALDYKLLCRRDIAVVGGHPAVIFFETIEHAARGALAFSELLIEGLELGRDGHLELGSLLTFEAAGPLVDFETHTRARGFLWRHNIEHALGHVIAGFWGRIRRSRLLLIVRR